MYLYNDQATISKSYNYETSNSHNNSIPYAFYGVCHVFAKYH